MFLTHKAHSNGHEDAAISTSLGIASIGVGLTELLATRFVEKLLGINRGAATGVIRTLGVRELMHGVDLLSHKEPTKGLWGRVAGDLLDSALLLTALWKSKKPSGVAIAFAAVTPIVLADMLLAPKKTMQK